MDTFADVSLKHPNTKICLMGLQNLNLMIDTYGGVGTHFNSVIEHLIERMGHMKESIRDQALDCILKFMKEWSPATVFDRMRFVPKHRSARVRENYMICFVGAIQLYGAESLSFSAFLPQVHKLLTDSQPTVREAAIQVLETMYKYSGEELVGALSKFKVRSSVMDPILARFDQIEVVPEDQRVTLKEDPLRRSRSRTPRRGARTPGTRTPRSMSRGRGTKSGSATPRTTSRSRPATARVDSGMRRTSKTPNPRSTSSSKKGTETKGSANRRGSLMSRGEDESKTSSRSSSRRRPKKNGTASRNAYSSVPTSRRSSTSSSRVGSRVGSRPGSKRGSRMGSRSGSPSRSMELLLADDVKKINVSHDRELHREFDKIKKTLDDTADSKSWKARIGAMQRLEGLILGGAVELETFGEKLWSIRSSIEIQVVDLRSVVAKEACTLLCALSRQMRDDFSQMADFIVPVLFKLTFVTIQVMAESGNAAIRCILQNTRIRRAIGSILSGCESRSDVLRLRCSEYLLIVLEVNSSSQLSKYVSDIGKTIVRLLADRSEEVRSTMRKCYWAFNEHFPDRARRMEERFDDMTIRMVTEEGEFYAIGAKRRAEAVEEELAIAQAEMSKKRSSVPVLPSRRPSLAAVTPGGPDEVTPGGPGTYRKRSNNGGVDLSSTHAGIGHLTRSETVSLNRTSNRTLKGMDRSESLKVLPNRSRSGRQSRGGTNSNTMHVRQGNSSSSFRDDTSTVGSIQSDGSFHLGRGRTGSMDEPERTSNSMVLLPGAKHDQVQDVLVQGRSLDPQDRMIAFDNLRALLKEGRSVLPDIYKNFPKLVDLLEDSVIDDDEVVCEKALLALGDVIRAVKLKVVPHLSRLLPNIFVKLTKKTPALQQAANSILIKISRSFEGDVIYPVVLEVMEVDDKRIQSGALEFLQHLMTENQNLTSEYFLHQPNVTDLFAKVHPFAYLSKKAKTRNVSVSIMVQIIETLNPDAGMAESAKFPPRVREKIFPQLQSFIPDFERRMTRYERAQQVAAAPAPVSHSPSYPSLSDEKQNGMSVSTSSRDLASTGMRSGKKSEFAEPDSPTWEMGNLNLTSDLTADLHEKIDIDSLLRNLSPLAAPTDRTKAIASILTMARAKDDALRDNFDELFLPLLELLEDKSVEVKEVVIMVMKEILHNFADQFSDFTYSELLTIHLLQLVSNSPPALVKEANATLFALAELAAPAQVYGVLITAVESDRGSDDALHSSVKMLSRLLERMPEAELRPALPRIIPALSGCFRNPNAMIRKDVVVCFVSLYTVIGEELMPKLAHLNMGQIKLIRKYIDLHVSRKPTSEPASVSQSISRR